MRKNKTGNKAWLITGQNFFNSIPMWFAQVSILDFKDPQGKLPGLGVGAVAH